MKSVDEIVLLGHTTGFRDKIGVRIAIGREYLRCNRSSGGGVNTCRFPSWCFPDHPSRVKMYTCTKIIPEETPPYDTGLNITRGPF